MYGNIFLTLGLFASLFTVIMYFLSYRGYSDTIKWARLGFHIMSVSVIAATLILMYAILTHNYEYAYVFNYSGGGLSTGLLMSTIYAGQAGSFLVWLLFVSIVGIILLDYTSKRGDLEPRVMMVFTLTAVFLLVMINPLLKNPFTYIWAEQTYINMKYISQSVVSMPLFQGFVFTDPQSGESYLRMGQDLHAAMVSAGLSVSDVVIQGKGLNPLLQNFWMQIHPPILFVGFAMAGVPFAFAIAAMMKNEYDKWVKQSLPWLLAGMMVLGTAIMLGGYWAYGVLGWGGYWGWDPVENSSLVPWLVGVAAIHTMLVQKRNEAKGGTGRFVKTNLILAVLTYVLVIYSTFLTRSGILSDASVHSFVAPGKIVFTFLSVFMLLFTFMGLGGVAYRWKYLSKHYSFEENVFSRELALFTGAVAILASAVIILAGTSAPIFGSAVEIRFYNELNLPLAIIIGLLNGFSLLLKWKHTNGTDILKKSRFSITATLVVSLAIILLAGITKIMMMIFVLSSAFALFVNLEIAYRIIKGRLSYLGAYVAHIGIALFLLGVIATSGFTESKQVELVKGEPVEVLGHTLTFTGYTPIDNGQKYAFNVEIKDGDKITVAGPVMYVAEFNNSLMREPDIMNMITRDFYVSPVSYTEGKNAASHGESVTLQKGNSIEYNGARITFKSFDFPSNAMSAMMEGKEFSIGALLEIEKDGKTYNVEPKMITKSGEKSFEGAEIEEADLKINLMNLDASGTVQLTLDHLNHEGHAHETAAVQKEVFAIEASVKPYINLVWAGVIIMALGFIISTVRRSRESLT